MKRRLSLVAIFALTAFSLMAYADGKGTSLYKAAEKTTMCSEKFFGPDEFDKSIQNFYCKPKAFNEYVKQTLMRINADKKVHDQTIKTLQKALADYGTWRNADWDINKKQTEEFLNSIEFIIFTEFDAQSKEPSPGIGENLVISFVDSNSKLKYFMSASTDAEANESCGKKISKYCNEKLFTQIKMTVSDSVLQNIDRFSSIYLPKNTSEEADIILSYIIPVIAISSGVTEATVDLKTGKVIMDEPIKKTAKKKHK